MEVRKIQVTGGSSYMITLPKEWAESVGLKKNAPISLEEHRDGTLTLHPDAVPDDTPVSKKIIQADEVKDPSLLFRQLVGTYIAGHDTIEVRSDVPLDTSIASIASDFVRTAMGLEILEEDDNTILIRDLINQDELDLMKTVVRMKILVKNMLNEVFNSLSRKDAANLKDIVHRDKEIDRLNWFIARQVSIYQKNVSLARKHKYTMNTVIACGSMSKTLERIGDHAVILCRNLLPLIEDDDTDTIDDEIVQIGRDVVQLVTDTVATWVDKDMCEANECIHRGEELVKRSIAISKRSEALGVENALAARTVAESVKRVTEYSMDISEMAINSAME